MTPTFFGRLIRPAVVFAAGMLVGQGALAIAGPAAPQATTLTRTASCAGLNFHPVDSRAVYDFDGRVLHSTSAVGNGWFLCDPNLPNKARVTRVRFTVFDDATVAEARYCALVRSSLGVADQVPTAMSVAGATGIAATPLTVRRTDTTIDNPVVDQANFGYWLQCQLAYSGGGGSNGIGIIGADVTYTISSTNG